MFLVILDGSWWFLAFLGGSWWFFVVLGGSWCFLVVLGGSWWFLVVFCGSLCFFCGSLITHWLNRFIMNYTGVLRIASPTPSQVKTLSFLNI